MSSLARRVTATREEAADVSLAFMHAEELTAAERALDDGANWRTVVRDAEPRTLYVRREVLNKAEIHEWARKWFDDPLIDDLHVTIIYSRAKVDWMKAGGNDWGQQENGNLEIAPGGPRMVDLFGPNGAEDTVVLMFNSSQLCYRNQSIREAAGASFDYDEYQPHISIVKQTLTEDELRHVEPYRGRIVLGPEIFEEVK